MTEIVSGVVADVRFAARQLRRSPGFALTAVVTLALGIGAATAMYSIVRSTLLEPLPYPREAELVGIDFAHSGGLPYDEQTGETADFMLAHATSFSNMGVADDGAGAVNFSVGGGRAKSIRALRVSSGYLPALGVPPLLGRTFTTQEDRPGASPVAIVSESLWRGSLGGDAHVLGRVIHIAGDPFTVIGVMPSSFATVDAPDVWRPMQLSPADPGYQGDNYQMIARLRPGITIAQASGELETLTAAFFRQFPHYKHWGGPGAPVESERVWPLRDVVASSSRGSLLSLSAAVIAVLLIACLNLAGLITARSASRQREIAVRSALGAGRWMLLRLLLIESLMLAAVGSMLGLGFSSVVMPLLLRAAPIDLPRLHETTTDGHALLFALAIGYATTLIFGLLPALGVLRARGSLASGTRSVGDSVPQQRLGRVLLVGQVALATTLLSISALLLGTFLNLRAIPSGVRPQHLYAMQVNLKGTTYASATHTQQFVAAVEERLRGIPGITAVAASNGLPLDGGLNESGYPTGHKEMEKNVEWRSVTPGYLATTGTTLTGGQDFSDSDTAVSQPIALINERAAKLWFPNRSAIGESVMVGGGEPRRIIGVVADVHAHGLAEAIARTVYVPYAQVDDTTMAMINGWFPTTFMLRVAPRADVRGADIAKAASAAVAAVDADVPVGKFSAMQGFIDKSVAAPRFFSWLAGAFAIFAVLLTVIGIFGLLSYQVAARTREFGVRMALGAQRVQVLSLVIRRGLALTAIGLTLGALASLVLRPAIASFLAETIRFGPASLPGIMANPALSILTAAAGMLLAATAASLLPASRAASIQPTEALRAE